MTTTIIKMGALASSLAMLLPGLALAQVGPLDRAMSFSFATPDASQTVTLVAVLIGSAIVGFAVYRFMLEGHVRAARTHPNTLGWSCAALAVALFLIALAYFMPGLGLGWLNILGVILLIVSLFMRLLGPWLLLALAALALIIAARAFQIIPV
jgi:hypothetical protein